MNDLSNHNNEEARTRFISQPFGAFKNPHRPSKKERLSLRILRFLLPNGETLDVDVTAQAAILLGRQEGNEHHIDIDLSKIAGVDSGVSRTHAVIQVTHRAVFLRDFESRNGTYVNGEELYPNRDYTLQDGDELRLGRAKLRIQFIDFDSP